MWLRLVVRHSDYPLRARVCRDYSETVYCSPFTYISVLNALSQAITVLGILLVNWLILAVIVGITKMERHHTHSEESRVSSLLEVS